MNNLKTYKDSKEFPLVNFERIETTSNFFYMVKGYEAGDEIQADQAEMKELFNAVVQDYVVSLNAKNYDIVQHGKIQAIKTQIVNFYMVKSIIVLHIEANNLRIKAGLPVNDDTIVEMLKIVRIQKTKNLNDQLEVIDRKIQKLKNDINEYLQKLEKNKTPDSEDSADINQMITNVELILERTIDMEKTSLYRFGIMQDQARKKIEHLNKSQNGN